MKAIKCYEEASEKDNPSGCFHLANHYLDIAAQSNENEDYFRAMQLLRKCIQFDANYAKAYYFLGFLY